MSQLIFAQAKSILKQAEKHAREMEEIEINKREGNISVEERTTLREKEFDKYVTQKRTEFKKILGIAALLHEDYRETYGETKNWYFITIRPDETKCNFIEFYKKVYKYINRKCIGEYTLSFEQKGTTTNDLGKGFHVHIVAKTTHRSKGECLRDTQSTFNSIAAPNCIDISTTRNPDEIVKKYLTNYESKDNHKECTKDFDNEWRSKNNLEHLYVNNLPLSPTEVTDVPLSIKSGQTEASIIELP